MSDLTFRSLDRFSQSEFARWLATVPAGEPNHYELLDGHIVREPPAGYPHGNIEVRISARLQAFVDEESPGLVFGSSQGFELPTGDTVEPDVSFVSADRWSTLPRPVCGFPRVVPELVFEILSPGTARLDRKEKKRIYEHNRVQEYGLVDPETRTVEWFRLTADGFDEGQLYQEGELVRSLVLAGLVLPVGDLFPEV